MVEENNDSKITEYPNTILHNLPQMGSSTSFTYREEETCKECNQLKYLCKHNAVSPGDFLLGRNKVMRIQELVDKDVLLADFYYWRDVTIALSLARSQIVREEIEWHENYINLLQHKLENATLSVLYMFLNDEIVEHTKRIEELKKKWRLI